MLAAAWLTGLTAGLNSLVLLLSAIFQGKSTFLTGFGLGFLAFGLKKLLLPLIFGVQIIKSVLLALFLPSIIGSIGNMVGKGTCLSCYLVHRVISDFYSR